MTHLFHTKKVIVQLKTREQTMIGNHTHLREK